ncbi:TadE/TadG family type IV pilus assembly protein [Telluria aromaticivorans]|uniref:Pilus assembly protein n=1 Tax=Telluria aromaticivorans TaxID=2725995 RepID=A0A7Y2JVL0_9BURK|nr:TadE family protein [Telluria aromaticivorans]NNG21726.1 pilus assembly protein [Telluria aromaticivorans]
MKTNTFAIPTRRQTKRESGVAAVEVAILMPILIVFITFPIFFARIHWHYTVIQKAAQDAARYLSTVPRSEMMSQELAESAGELAIEIAEREIAELSPGSSITGPTAYCDGVVCGELGAGTVPRNVQVRIMFTMSDPDGLIDFGWYGLRLTANYTLPYVGN